MFAEFRPRLVKDPKTEGQWGGEWSDCRIMDDPEEKRRTEESAASLLAAVLGLNAVNTAIFAASSVPPSFTPPAQLCVRSVLTAIPSAVASSFSHGHRSHLALNMVVFNWLSFGLRGERDAAMHAFSLYTCGALGGAAGHSMKHAVVGARNVPVRGASGVVCAVAAALPILPASERQPTLPLLPPVEIPVCWGCGAVLLALLNPRDLTSKSGGARLSIGAHVGGAVAGLLYGLVWRSA